MTSQPRAFFALDLGSATTSGAVLGHVGGRWRLIAHAAAPCHVSADSILSGLLSQVAATDPDMLAELGAGERADIPTLVATWPRLIAKTTPQRRLAVLAGSRRQRKRLETAALRAGWLVVGGSADEDDPVALARLILAVETSAVLLGADNSPGGDERRHLPDLAALVAAATMARPELTVVLAGGAAVFESAFVTQADGRFPPAPAVEPGAAELPAESAPDEVEQTDDKATVQTKRLPDLPASYLTTEAADEADGVETEAERAEAGTADAHEAGADAAGTAVEAADSPSDASEPGVSAAEPDLAVPEAPEPSDTAEAAPMDEPRPSQAGAETPETPGPIESAAAAEASETNGSARSAASEAETSGAGPMPLGFHALEAAAVSTHVLLAPDAEAGQPAGASLQQVLEGLRALPNDSRLGIVRSIGSLAYVLDRPIQIVEVGLQGGLVAWSEPFGQGHFTMTSSHACLADASFAPASPSEEVIDGVIAWSTTVLDRHRAMDRLNDLRLVPWGESDGDGAIFRLAAAKAACIRLIEATPEMDSYPMPELLIAAGGPFSALPPSVVALALCDLVRRPGVSQLAIDQARLLGPLGAIEDEAERRQLLANLADDILLPLGGLIMPSGIRQGRTAGFLRLKGATSLSEIELHPGAVQVVDLPPGRAARADIDFRDAVRLGKRAHHFSLDVGGGLGGLLVDLRDIPMRISDRPDSRRAALDAWQRGMWPEIDE